MGITGGVERVEILLENLDPAHPPALDLATRLWEFAIEDSVRRPTATNSHRRSSGTHSACDNNGTDVGMHRTCWYPDSVAVSAPPF